MERRLGPRQVCRDDDVLRPRRHPAAVRAGGHVHHLRRLPLLGLRVHEPEPQLPVVRHDGFRARKQPTRGDERGLLLRPRRLRVADLPRTAGEGWRLLADLSGVGQLHRQRRGVLPDLQADRSQDARCGGRQLSHHGGVLRLAGPEDARGAEASRRPARRRPFPPRRGRKQALRPGDVPQRTGHPGLTPPGRRRARHSSQGVVAGPAR